MGFWCNLGRKLIDYRYNWMICNKHVLCPIAKNFLPLQLLFGGCGIPKIFGDWKYASPLFGRCLLWPNGGMDQDATWYGGMPAPCDIVLDGDPAPPRNGAQQLPTFRPTALARVPAGPHFIHKHYCLLGSAQQLALVAIQPDNCHLPSFTF